MELNDASPRRLLRTNPQRRRWAIRKAAARFRRPNLLLEQLEDRTLLSGPGDFEWLRQFGSSVGVPDGSGAVAADGSVYVAGLTYGILPGQTSAGDIDAFLRKYDAAGNELWTRQFGWANQDQAIAVVVDASGIYVAGNTSTVPGALGDSAFDPFVRKYDADGNVVWHRQFGTTSRDAATDIAVDGSGVYVAGFTEGALPGFPPPDFMDADAFVRKYDTDGNEVWTRQFGPPSCPGCPLSGALAFAIAVGSSGVYVTGSASALPGQTSSGLFVRKYDAAGTEVWTRQGGLANGEGIAVDVSGVYVAGGVPSGQALPGQTSAGSGDAFVRKYDASGNEQWTHQFGTANGDGAHGITVDASGVYVVGSTAGALPGQTSAGGIIDAFVRKYDASGSELWTRQFGTAGLDGAGGVTLDAGAIYISGGTDGTFPGQTSAGSGDVFVRKYDASATDVWTRQFGSLVAHHDVARAVDAEGNVYVAGTVVPGAVPGQILPPATSDVFLSKFDAAGNELWTRQFGAPSSSPFSSLPEDIASGIAVDASGVYVAGSTTGLLPGQTSTGIPDAFVRKYDLDGNEVWTRQFGSSSGDWATAITADGSGVYVAGFTDGIFAGGGSSRDAFVRKYNIVGNVVWTSQFGTSGADQATGIAVDFSGVYVSGNTSGALPGQTSAGGQDAFVRKYNAGGAVVWTRQFGTAALDQASGIAADASGVVYVGGFTAGAFAGQTSAGGNDAFVRKYDGGGTELWTRQFGSTESDQANGIAATCVGVYVAGQSLGTLPGQTSAGGQDAFVGKYDPSGTEVWTRQFGTSAADSATGITAGASGVFVTGVTFGVLPGQAKLGVGDSDAFVAKIVESVEPCVLNTVPSNVIRNPSAFTINENTTLALTGSFTDPDTADTHTVVIDWGPGEGTTTLNLPAGVTAFSTSHLYPDDAPPGTPSDIYPINITVSDAFSSATAGMSLVVKNVPPSANFNVSVSEDEGSAIQLSLTDPSDPSSADVAAGFEYAFDCGSGFGPWSSSNLATCPTTDSGSHKVQGKIRDKDRGERKYNTYITDEDTTLTVAVPGVLADFPYDDDLGAPTASLVSGPTHGTLALNADGSFIYTPAADFNGMDAFSFRPSYSFVTIDTVIVPIEVIPVDDVVLNTPPSNVSLSLNGSANENETLTLSGSFTDPDIADTHAVVINWGPGEGTTTLTLAAGVTTFSASHLYPDDNPTGTSSDVYPVSVTVSDASASTSSGTSLVVSNVAPDVAITSPESGFVVSVGTPITFTGFFTDAGTADTHSASWTFGNVTIAGTVTQGSGSGLVSDTHTFTAPGVYSVTLTVTDDDGGAGSATTVGGLAALLVVYDPSAGFVTGGGWIDSPAGAYTPDPALTGRASFGFVSKFRHGTTIPEGQTEFQFKTGNLNFHSTSYDWLVVAGARAQFKGTGTINGGGDYAFLLTAIDGQLPGGGGDDKFRIKIWDKSSGAIIYDNQLGALDGDVPTTVLRGGSIVIQSSNLLATEVGPFGQCGGQLLLESDIEPLLAAAHAHWSAAGEDTAALSSVDFRIADLGGPALGLTAGSTIWLDQNAAGWGWQSSQSSSAVQQIGMDLLTVLTHEMGHILGHEHDDEGLMAETLAVGEHHLTDHLLAAGIDWNSFAAARSSSGPVREQPTEELLLQTLPPILRGAGIVSPQNNEPPGGVFTAKRFPATVENGADWPALVDGLFTADLSDPMT